MATYWNVAKLVAGKKWENAHRFSQEAKLSYPIAWRIWQGDKIDRIDAKTLESLCRTFEVGPTELLRFDPPLPAAKRAKR